MKCAINIGNTHVAIALKYEGKLIRIERYKTEQCSNLVALEQIFQSFFSTINARELKAVILASVVPSLDELFCRLIKNSLGLSPCIISQESLNKLNFDYSAYDASSLGIDRLVLAYIVKKQCTLPAVIIDLGTATAFSVLNQSGEFIGGIIMPGMYAWGNALSKNTALLSNQAAFVHAECCIGKNTLECMSIGFLQGMGILIDGFLKEINTQFTMGLKNVIVTGGGAEHILPYCHSKICYRKEILLEGLFLMYEDL